MTLSLDQISARIAQQLIPAPASAGSLANSLPIWTAKSGDDPATQSNLSEPARRWLQAIDWKPNAGAYALLPGEQGPAGVILGLGREDEPFHPLVPGALTCGTAPVLPEGTYHFVQPLDNAELGALAWVLGSYHFDAFKTSKTKPRALPRLILPDGADHAAICQTAEAVWFGRELINYPANAIGPSELAEHAGALAARFGADLRVIEGDDLLKQNFPMIHAVGRASDRAPCLIDFSWGAANAPKLTIVGKGICFDTGGLNIKPPSAMGLMKKDMGGAATALTLAFMVMAAGLPVRLRVLIPAADNNISENAFRPGDILTSRNGMTVEVANTDAEGRLVLADALSLADEEAPDYLIDFATLTGAARVALGPDLPPFYTEDDALADRLAASSQAVADPLWRMPFWQPYDANLKSRVADVNHIYAAPFAGSITAALFLKRFVKRASHYIHFDIYGWTPRNQPARPQGGEPQGARAVFAVIDTLFPRAR